MRAEIIKIGNSRGLRIPKAIIEQCGLEGEVELLVRHDELTIKTAHRPRHGWDMAFRSMAHNRDDQLLDKPIATKWEKTEWEWS